MRIAYGTIGDVVIYDDIEYIIVKSEKYPDQEGGRLVLELAPVIDPRRATK
jgi:hypothetical protein